MKLQPLADDSLTDRVAGRIRDAIHEGRYPPGARLVERTLAAELGVSHIPVREALVRLTDQGLVERAPRRGARVATLTPRELEELSSLRIVLERFVVTRVQELRAATAALELDALEEHAASHDELLDAILSGDAETGCAEMTRHIELATERLRDTLDAGDGDD